MSPAKWWSFCSGFKMLPQVWYCSSMEQFKTLRLRQDGRHFPDEIFKCIFLNENVWILFTISLKCVRKVRINNIPSLVQIMAWRQPSDKPLSEPMCEWLNKSPLPTNVSDTVNAPLPYTLDIDESGANNSCSLSDVAECSIILDKNTPPSEFYLITIPFIRQ